MKRNLLTFIVMLLLPFAGVSVYGGAIETVIIDENGNGTWVDENSVTYTFRGTFTTDPSGGVASGALVYDTSVAYDGATPVTGFTFNTTGDYRILDPSSGTLVGIVRFFSNNRMIFYDADVGPGGESLADGSGLTINSLGGFDQGFDQTGTDELTVQPVSGMAGFATGIDRTYTFLSVLPVPEPGVFSLLACSAMLLALRRKSPVARKLR